MNKFKQLWSNPRSSFWFLPWLIDVISIAFAVSLIERDSAWSDRRLARVREALEAEPALCTGEEKTN